MPCSARRTIPSRSRTTCCATSTCPIPEPPENKNEENHHGEKDQLPAGHQRGAGPGNAPRPERLHHGRRQCRRRRRARRGRRLGRRAGGHQGPLPPVPRPRAGYPVVRDRLCRRRGRRRHPRHAPGVRTDVRRLRRLLPGPDPQPGRQVPLHVRRQGGHPAGDPYHGRRRPARRRPAFADAHFAMDPHPRPQGGLPVVALRRQGPAGPGDPRQRPGDLLRAQAALFDAGRGTRGACTAYPSARRTSSATATTSPW